MSSPQCTLKQPWQTAALIAELMQRAGANRARISEKTLKALSGRAKLEGSIRQQITDDLKVHGYLMLQLQDNSTTRGNVVIAMSTLRSAKSTLASDHFSREELRSIIDGSFDFDALHYRLLGEDDEDDGDSA